MTMHQPWSLSDYAVLVRMFNEGKSTALIADELGRRVGPVRGMIDRLRRLGVPMEPRHKKKGSSRPRRLGPHSIADLVEVALAARATTGRGEKP